MNGFLAKTTKELDPVTMLDNKISKSASRRMNSGVKCELFSKRASEQRVKLAMWGLEMEPVKTESALHKGDKLCKRACNTWSNKLERDFRQLTRSRMNRIMRL